MPRRNHTPKHAPFVPAKTCGAKRRYPDEQAARYAAETQELKDLTLVLSVYKCDLCGAWHLTRGLRKE